MEIRKYIPAAILEKRVTEKLIQFRHSNKRLFLRAYLRKLRRFYPDMSGKKIVFICGLHRSGTSILHRVLRSHPEVSGFSGTGVAEDEGQHLQDVFLRASEVGGAGRFCLDGRLHLTEDSISDIQGARKKLLRQWGAYWDPRKTILIEKSPPNLIRTRLLQQLFPESVFLVIIRHPIVTTLASAKMTIADQEDVLRNWFVGHALFMEDKQSLRNVYVLRYEDFVRNSNRYLGVVFNWLSIESMCVHETISDHNPKYFEKFKEMVAQKKYNTISEDFMRHLSIKYAALLKELNYSFQEPFVHNGFSWE